MTFSDIRCPDSAKMTNSTVVLTYEQPAAKQGNVIKVTGTVKDSSGEPLAGAGVLVKGTTIGTNTNLDGKYSIEVNADDVLEYSFIGFKNHDEKVNGRGVIDAMISEDANVLDDVVVVGYGTQSRKTLTTAISKVDGNSIYAAPVSSVGDALERKGDRPQGGHEQHGLRKCATLSDPWRFLDHLEQRPYRHRGRRDQGHGRPQP